MKIYLKEAREIIEGHVGTFSKRVILLPLIDMCEEALELARTVMDDADARANTIIEADNFLTRWGGDDGNS